MAATSGPDGAQGDARSPDGAIPDGAIPDGAIPDDEVPEERVLGERRGLVVVAGLLAVGLPFAMPDTFRSSPGRVMGAIQLILLVAMFVLDPGRIDRRSRPVHLVRLALIGSLALGAALGVLRLVGLILERHGHVAAAPTLLWAGGLVWVHLVLAFAFLYWELDAGGPGERAHHRPRPGDFVFPQQADPRLGGGDWRPVFFDYLHVAVTGALSFSPADVVVLTHRAKAAVMVESLSSIAVLGLVVARAVNLLG